MVPWVSGGCRGMLMSQIPIGCLTKKEGCVNTPNEKNRYLMIDGYRWYTRKNGPSLKRTFLDIGVQRLCLKCVPQLRSLVLLPTCLNGKAAYVWLSWLISLLMSSCYDTVSDNIVQDTHPTNHPTILLISRADI